ncbi:MAG: 3-hydroxyacyl-CoA dehydrogenase [Deltaproteobacteria bacterium]|nr:3-hydroxyacyl-CoA dehydrogenase [Deltaproteobacteria bacterium]
MKIDDIRKILIIGAGTMGQQIAFQCAISGYEVVLYDVGPAIFESSLKRIAKLAGSFRNSGRLTPEEAEASLKRIHCSSQPEEAAKDIDFVSESVPEDPALKARVFSQFNRLCPAHTIFTTNTSTLIPSMIAEATGRPDKFAAFHFHDIRVTNIVDIMPHSGTSAETLSLIQAFAARIGQIAILLKKENYGYVFNAMLTEVFKAAQTLAAGNVAEVEDIDRAWMGIMHTPVGPFGMMDSIGLDTVWKVTDYWARKGKDPQTLANAAFMKEYVDKGRLGTKSGQGFYQYPGPAYSAPQFLTGSTEPEIASGIKKQTT